MQASTHASAKIDAVAQASSAPRGGGRRRRSESPGPWGDSLSRYLDYDPARSTWISTFLVKISVPLKPTSRLVLL